MQGDNQTSLMVGARDFVCGAACVDELFNGWVRPQRFLPEQRRALGTCAAWYPGIYRQMAQCTSGVCLEFETDSTQISLEVRLDSEPKATRDILRGSSESVTTDGFSFEVDGAVTKFISVADIEPAEVAHLELVLDGTKNDIGQMSLLPLVGMGDVYHVCVWLPLLRGCEIGHIAGDGTFIRAVEREDRPQLLVLGDASAQGFGATAPHRSWAYLVAQALKCELFNQSLAAQVFQPSALIGLEQANCNPSLVVVSLGSQYCYARASERIVAQDIANYLRRVDTLFGSTKVLVLAPNTQEAAVEGSCFSAVASIINEVVAAIEDARLREGRPPIICAQTPAPSEEKGPNNAGALTDAGHKAMSEFVLREVQKFECTCLQTSGAYGRCGSCMQADK